MAVIDEAHHPSKSAEHHTIEMRSSRDLRGNADPAKPQQRLAYQLPTGSFRA